MPWQEGASKEDIDQLSKYKFRKTGDNEKLSGDAQGPAGGVMTECGTDSPIEHFLAPEDAVCFSNLFFLFATGIIKVFPYVVETKSITDCNVIDMVHYVIL